MQGHIEVVFGTYRLKHVDALEKALTMAYDLGIRHFDTAQLYGNEEVVGRVLQALCLRSGDAAVDDPITITTKYWDSGLPTMDLIAAKIKGSISRLRGSCDPAALKLRVLLHHPALAHVWRVLEDLEATTPFLQIGVCNHNPKALEALFAYGPRVIPCVNQVEVHPLLPPGELDELLQCCAQSNVPVEAHSVMIRGLHEDVPARQLFEFAANVVGDKGRICITR